jgi:hypothetical protein
MVCPSIQATRDQGTYPFSPQRVFGSANNNTKGLVADALEIVEPFTLRKEASGCIRGEPAIGKLILPLDVKGSLPEIVFPRYFDSDWLLQCLLPLCRAKNYIRRDRLSNRR